MERNGRRGNFRGRRGRGRFQRSSFRGTGPPNKGQIEYRHNEQLSESEVGITQFVSDAEGVTGIIKARFSDFQVNEIDLDGNIAKLSDKSIPECFHEKKTPEIVAFTQSALISQEFWEEVIDEATRKEEKKVVEIKKEEGDAENTEKNDEKVETNKPDDREYPEYDITNLSKEDRTSVHEALKKYFGTKIVSQTIEKNGKKFIQVRKSNTSRNDNRFQWPENIGKFVHFVVYKENLDTMDAAYKIANALQMKANNFAYAGIKDKRGKTTQWFSVRQVHPGKLMAKARRIYSVFIGNVCFKNYQLRLGDLKGNRFRIALRNVTAEDEIINKAVEVVRDKGFINYYGLQRFGNDKDVPTYDIGIKLLQGNFKEACELILKPKKADQDNDLTKAKNVYHETKSAEKALNELTYSKNKCAEAKLLDGLSKHHENDYVNALESIPRNMRLLYLHAFQSLVWNKITSLRLEKYGYKPVEGDIVVINDETPVKIERNDELEAENMETNVEEDKADEIKVLKKEDLKNYTIFDIVLPLPGYDVVYPENVKEDYKTILESYGLSLEMPKQSVSTYTLSGKYRKIMEKINNVSWSIVKYNDPNLSLIQSDLEEMRQNDPPINVPDGAFKALVLDFCLNASCYATMVLREIMKTDTSTSAQAKQNNYHESKTKEDNSINPPDYTESLESTSDSLLDNVDKLEAFKNSIFENLDSGELKNTGKHVLEEENTGQSAKKLKKGE